jgi:hypothetical protein
VKFSLSYIREVQCEINPQSGTGSTENLPATHDGDDDEDLYSFLSQPETSVDTTLSDQVCECLICLSMLVELLSILILLFNRIKI